MEEWTDGRVCLQAVAVIQVRWEMMSTSSRAEAMSLGWEGYRAFRQEDKQVDDLRRKGDGDSGGRKKLMWRTVQEFPIFMRNLTARTGPPLPPQPCCHLPTRCWLTLHVQFSSPSSQASLLWICGHFWACVLPAVSYQVYLPLCPAPVPSHSGPLQSLLWTWMNTFTPHHFPKEKSKSFFSINTFFESYKNESLSNSLKCKMSMKGQVPDSKPGVLGSQSWSFLSAGSPPIVQHTQISINHFVLKA